MMSYMPYGQLRKAWACKDERVLIDGPAGTGKTRCLLEKADTAMRKYAGARALLVRKVRRSMTQTVLETFEKKVVSPASPLLNGEDKARRQSYKYANGSEIVVGGLDDVSRIMSSEYDIIYIFEATETDENDFEALTTRINRPGHIMPYNQIALDCNPGGEMHWIKKEADAGMLTRIPSTHTDNPGLYDQHKQAWTDDGVKYMHTLGELTGHRLKRLRYGEWASAEGVVYDMFSRKRNVICAIPDDKIARYIIACDYGTTNPCTFGLYSQTPGGVKTLVKEYWHDSTEVGRQKTDSEYANDLEKFMPQRDKIEAIVVDPSAASFIEEIRRRGLPVYQANNDVLDGIRRLGDEIRTERWLIDSKCEYTIKEYGTYGWDRKAQERGDDKPMKTNDHAMDRDRYACAYLLDHPVRDAAYYENLERFIP